MGSKRIMLEYKGETHCISDCARVTGINRKTIYNRLKSGWPIGKSLGYEERMK